MSILRHPLLRALPLLLAGAAAHAQAVNPSSYDMPNDYGQANNGSFNYWDRAYNGSGDTLQDFAPLSGGLGDLSDGVVASDNWYMVENVAGTGPYVGWSLIDPVITFHFAAPVNFGTVTVWHDDANNFGNVGTPLAFIVTVGGRSQTFDIVDPATDLPFASVLTLGAGFTGDRLELQVLRRDSAVFLSEVAFTTAVPEPGSWALIVAGLLGLAPCREQRVRQQREAGL